jgi:hypothetical protein
MLTSSSRSGIAELTIGAAECGRSIHSATVPIGKSGIESLRHFGIKVRGPHGVEDRLVALS